MNALRWIFGDSKKIIKNKNLKDIPMRKRLQVKVDCLQVFQLNVAILALLGLVRGPQGQVVTQQLHNEC